MSFLLTAIVFVVIFSVLVIIHECGHFFAAKRSGIKVEEFGFGLPPRIWGVKKGETLYSLNLIPFGGFVKLLGEDAHDPKALKDKRSFAAQSVRVRIFVIVAGVAMNFLLALVLLMVGFSVGMQPLILSSDDVLTNIQKNIIQIEPGVVVKTVGKQAEADGLQVGDKILGWNEQVQQALKDAKNPLTVNVLRNDEQKQLTLMPLSTGGFDVTVKDFFYLPRLQVQAVSSSSPYKDLMEGDVLLKINGTALYGIDDFHEVTQKFLSLRMEVLRGDKVIEVEVNLPPQRVIVNDVLANSPAEKAGIKIGDIVTAINGKALAVPQDFAEVTQKSSGKELTYSIIRDGQLLSIPLKPGADGLVGVGLSSIYAPINSDLTLFSRDLLTSIVAVNDVQYPLWEAPLKAVEESGRLALLTVKMFGNVLASIFTTLSVPEGVAGPVGIAQMTYVFVQEGFVSVLRFVALLSLSLAVINVFPFPALDGGRLLFIVLEVIIGKRVQSRYEAIIHAAGFIILMALIFFVTYSDILKIL